MPFHNITNRIRSTQALQPNVAHEQKDGHHREDDKQLERGIRSEFHLRTNEQVCLTPRRCREEGTAVHGVR